MKLKAFSNMLQKLRSVEQKLTKEFEKSTGFSLTRYEILIYLRDNGNSLQTEIADYLDIDPAAVTRHLKILEEKDYVKRKRNKENGREVIVSLTDYAIAELAKCKEKQSKNQCELPVPFNQEEIEKLMDILKEIEKKLQ
ncbi:MarR family winged helix-turn-helix transcriptional regulator [Clostridium perfringens]|mgnify:CR=1 FL=1|uniref:MarR family winged helix-turn-helix transcriptional regulator n=1 Tax=Clostridium perfringens TaxID=1502 RepID=UPI002856981C|nr:winged helix-turn-helix transcriptional regulator [Clostridium perfringens]MDK0898710.1 MarR family winged helix-turn-helix transcriptional regulator [Clostridium perfringens]MDK0904178.1 MarR family winged helix-turn-helix transcriptional regulator [Clostridium perfringens]MDK0982661.1 MarR family winged helix-turn-helix transcriptional regulator [Clostridium perfringens]MDM0902457.1 MarR family winged helix-turn-helix transcriptional regulator [Clostridium perfringens]